MQKMLIADDQVPNGNLSSEADIRDHYGRLYGDPGFAEGFVFIRRLINLLRTRGYSVDSANTPDRVIELAKNETYNLVVLDLGWYTVEKMPKDEKMVLGWKLAEEIKRNSSAQILMFSNRLYEDQELAHTAAEKKCLPVYKSYDDACLKNLLVTIRWAAFHKSSAETLTEEQKFYSFKMYRWLSKVLLASILGSLVLLLATVILVVTNNTETTVASSIFGVVSTLLAVLFISMFLHIRRIFLDKTKRDLIYLYYE
jgi:CheY-like chemotaxis protein